MKLKVLVTDDVELYRQNTVSILSNNENVDCILEAQDGREELNKIMEEKPDIVITDMKMPEMTGLEVIKEIKKSNLEKKPQFILVTSDRSSDLMSQIRELGEILVYKPLDSKTLNQYIDEYYLANQITKEEQKCTEISLEKIEEKEKFWKKILKFFGSIIKK